MSSSKLYDQICMFKNPHHKEILYAIDIVRDFIKDRKLILYGGTAIDYALRLCGDKIYHDNIIPDYDFYSPNFIKDTYDLVDIIYKALDKPKELRCHPAVHFGTMTIKLYDLPVADISSNTLFDKIPTMEYQGILITKPLFQYIDMHSSLALPFANSPMEVIFHRLEKDVSRLALLQKYYPPKSTKKMTTPAELKHIPDEPVVLAGITAGQAILDIIEDGKLTALYGNEFYINHKEKMDQPYGNMTFPRREQDGLTLYNIYGNQFLIAGTSSLDGKEIMIPNINMVLRELLGQYFITGNENYLSYYTAIIKQKKHKLLKLYPYPERLFGTISISPIQKFKLSKMAETIGGDKIADEYLVDLSKMPKGYSPAISETRGLPRPDKT